MTETIADKNWRIVEQAKAAFAGCEWEKAYKLFEASRQICLEQGWGAGVHFADDMIILLFPHLSRNSDSSLACSIDHDDIKDELRAINASHVPMHGELPVGVDEEAFPDRDPDSAYTDREAGRFVAEATVLSDDDYANHQSSLSEERLQARRNLDNEHLSLEYARMKSKDVDTDLQEEGARKRYRRSSTGKRRSLE
jgi:hypothetical protein